jgi:hypothetical protein
MKDLNKQVQQALDTQPRELSERLVARQYELQAETQKALPNIEQVLNNLIGWVMGARSGWRVRWGRGRSSIYRCLLTGRRLGCE